MASRHWKWGAAWGQGTLPSGRSPLIGGDCTLNEGPVIVTEALSKVYGSLKAVDSISLSVQPGEIFGVLGPNGAGKTTLLEMMVGLRTSSSGVLRVLGLDPRREKSALVKYIGVQPQEASLFPNLRVMETLELFASFHREPLAPRDVLEQIGLEDKAGELVRRLSGGQRKRLVLGVALVANPRILFLDEPTASLDPQARRQLWSAVRQQRERGCTVILTTHYLEEAEELCDRVSIVNKGKLLALGTPQELVRQYFAEQTVVYETNRPVDRSRLIDLPGVQSATVVSKGAECWQVRLCTTQPEQTLGALLSSTVDVFPRNLHMAQAALEDVFLALTGLPIAGADQPAPPTRKTAAGVMPK